MKKRQFYPSLSVQNIQQQVEKNEQKIVIIQYSIPNKNDKRKYDYDIIEIITKISTFL